MSPGRSLLLILVAIAVLIALMPITYKVYGVALEREDPMNQQLFICPFTKSNASWWPASHFLVFFVLGFLFPQCFLLAVVLGLLWEGLESIIEYATTPKTKGPAIPGVEYQQWASSSLRDIGYNVWGFLAGAGLAVLVRGHSIDPCEDGSLYV